MNDQMRIDAMRWLAHVFEAIATAPVPARIEPTAAAVLAASVHDVIDRLGEIAMLTESDRRLGEELRIVSAERDMLRQRLEVLTFAAAQGRRPSLAATGPGAEVIDLVEVFARERRDCGPGGAA